MKKAPNYDNMDFKSNNDLDKYYYDQVRLETWFSELCYHYTPLDLDYTKSGIFDAKRGYLNTDLIENEYYKIIHTVFTKLTTTQQLILDYFICSGYNHNHIAELQNYKTSRAVYFHLEAISAKVNKLFRPSEVGLPPTEQRKIVDPYTGRYEGESTSDWFKRMEDE